MPVEKVAHTPFQALPGPYTENMRETNPMTDSTFNGWANWATWNVSLWIQNDEGLYSAAKECRTYQDLVMLLRECGSKETPDGCRWDDPAIDGIEINDLIQDLH